MIVRYMPTINSPLVLTLIGLCLMVHVNAIAQDKGSEEPIGSSANTTDQAGELTDEQAAAIAFNPKFEGPLFVYSVGGGMGATPNAAPIPKLQIFTDGRVLTGSANGAGVSLQSKMKPAELKRFLNFVVNENKFYQYDQADVDRQMKAGKAKVVLVDAASANFRMALNRGQKTVSVYALFNAIKNFPEIESIVHIANIEKRCNQIVSKIHMGDDQEKVLSQVNKVVAARAPKLKPFSVEEIQYATRLPNGRFQVRFERTLPNQEPSVKEATENPDQSVKAGDAQKKIHVIYFQKSGQDQPTVQIYGLPQEKMPNPLR